MEFCKLNKQFSISNYTIMREQISFLQEGKGISYHYVDFPYKCELLNIIPKQYQNEFCVRIMKINTMIPPHTDSGIKSTINLYIKSDNCLTQFYNFKQDNPQTHQVNNQTDGFVYQEEDLIKTNSFVAKNNEAWLLDVTKPHSVIPQGKFNDRLAVAIGSTLEYNVMKDVLRESGYL